MRASEQVSWTFVGKSSVGVLEAEYRHQSFPPHTHDHFVIGVNEGSSHRTVYRRQHHLVPPGVLAVIPPGEVHTGASPGDGPWRYRAVYPTGAALASVCAQVSGRESLPTFSSLVLDDPGLVSAFLAAHQGWVRRPKDISTEESLISFLAALVLRHGQGTRPRTRSTSRHDVHRAIEFMREAPQRDTSLEDLAGIAGLSPYHFIRAFKAEVGVTPYAFLIQLRVKRARRLLEQGHPIASTAFACGFADQSHLTRVFRSIVGATPGQYVVGISSSGAWAKEADSDE